MKPITSILLALSLTACAATSTTSEHVDTTTGPTVYGQISASVDHVSVD